MRLSILKAASAAPIMPNVPEGEPDARYPRNNRGQVEFASVLLTLDHLLDSDPLHANQKAVYSTRTPAEMLIHLMNNVYHDTRDGFTNSPATFEILKQLDTDPDSSIALYFVPATTRDRTGGLIAQVVLSMVCLQRLVTHPKFGDGSACLAMNALVDAVALMAQAHARQTAKAPVLLLMQLQEGPGDQTN